MYGVKMAWYSTCSLLLLLFRTSVKKGHLDENDFRYCYGNFFFESSILKVLDHSYVQSSFSRIKWHIENSIVKDTLQLNDLRTWINIRAKSFIKTSVNIDESAWKNISCTKIQACTLKDNTPK